MTTLGITAAEAATTDMNEQLQPAIDELRSAINVVERNGVYRDIAAVRAALVRMKFAIDRAQRLSRRVDWPISPDRRRLIVRSLAGIAQVRAPAVSSAGGRGIKSAPRSTPSDEDAS